jgi:hypothetical protein
LSSRTARGAVGTVPEVMSIAVSEGSASHPEMEDLENIREPTTYLPTHQSNEHLFQTKPLFSTPTKHIPHESTSTDVTVQGSQSPSAGSTLSRDELGSMMFILGGNTSGTTGGRREGSWPAGVEENGSSDWGTPARGSHRELS